METPATRDYTRLPEPIALEATITSTDVVVPQEEGDEDARERGWMLRTAGAI